MDKGISIAIFSSLLLVSIVGIGLIYKEQSQVTGDASYYLYAPQERTFAVRDGAVYSNPSGVFLSEPCTNGKLDTNFANGMLAVFSAYPNVNKYALCFRNPLGGSTPCWIYSGANYNEYTYKLNDQNFCDSLKQILIPQPSTHYNSISMMEQESLSN